MSVPKITANSDARLRLVVEIEDTANAGGSSADLSGAAFDYLYEKSSDEMPYGTQKARDGDPFEWLDENVMPDYVTTRQSDTIQARLQLAIDSVSANISAFELRPEGSETEKAWAGGVVAGLRIAEKYMGIIEGGRR